MKLFNLVLTIAAVLALGGTAQAGKCDVGCGAGKSCGISGDCQPDCCKPVIVRPCCPPTYTYQRQCSTIKPPCCNTPNSRAFGGCRLMRKRVNQCCKGGCSTTCCDNGPACAAPCDANACGTNGACGNNGNSGCVVDPNACGTAGSNCCNNGSGNGCCPSKRDLRVSRRCADDCCEAGCAAPTDPACSAPVTCCEKPCKEKCCKPVDACTLAQLIYESQTACYPRQRKNAIQILNRRYTCDCSPEIMCAFLYAMNDSDPFVREAAADAIGDQLRKNCCPCSSQIVSAMTCALGDCHRGVRRQAEQALAVCGYDVIDGCCEDTCCESKGCAPACNNGCVKNEVKAPEVVTPVKVEQYFPAKLHNVPTQKDSLKSLFGMLN